MTLSHRAAAPRTLRVACLVAGALLLCAGGGHARARRARPLGVYVPALFKRVPAAMLVDDTRAGAAEMAGLYHTVDLAGQPEQIVVSVEGGALHVTRQRHLPRAAAPVVLPVVGASIAGSRLVAPSLRGRFVVVPYQVERRREGRTELVCRAGLLLDGYPQLLQREEAPRPCASEVARRVATGSLKTRRLLVEGRWALALSASPVRSRPLAAAATIGAVRQGDEVDIIDRLEGWLLIHGGGVEGFVPVGAVAP